MIATHLIFFFFNTGGAPPANDAIAQERSLFRFVFGRIFSRVN